ncbi:MAG: DUF3368 domain-containing protein [Bacteroidia bacterium]
MIVVSDTSSITNLIQVGQIGLLKTLFKEILISPTVKRELSVIQSQKDFIENCPWITVANPKDEELIHGLIQKLDLGEAESICLAKELAADFLLIDEYAGRKIANEMGLPIIGILGVLIKGKKEGQLGEVKPIIQSLVSSGFRLNQGLINNVLQALGE